MQNMADKADGKGEPMQTFSEALSAAKKNVGPSLRHAIADSAGRLSTVANEGSKALKRHVHDQPWAYVVGAGLLGLALGFFLVRR